MSQIILPFPAIRPDHADLVGGKGLSLGLTATVGLPVPLHPGAERYYAEAEQQKPADQKSQGQPKSP